MPAARKSSPVDVYRTHLQQLSGWDDYLRQESRLPGPHANLELIEAVIQAGDGSRFAHLLALDSSFPGGAPPNTPDEFLTVCAVAGLGKLVAEGDRPWLSVLRRRAADERWRGARGRRHRPPALGRPRHAWSGRRNAELEQRQQARTARRRRCPRRTAPAAHCRLH